MDTGTVAVAFAVLFALLLVGIPVAYSLLVSGTAGLLLLSGTTTTEGYLGGNAYSSVANFQLIVIPMFILMGMVVLRVGLASSLYAIAARASQRLPGGVALATVGACAGFAAVTGTSIAAVATLGKLCVDEMEAHGYPKYFAAATVGCCGTLGVMIPPSVSLVLFGLVTNISIGGLLLAGIIPGLLSALVYAVMIVVLVTRGWVKVEPPTAGVHAAGPDGPLASARVRPIAGGGKAGLALRDYFAVLEVLFLFVAVSGGVYFGWYTAAEGGAVGVMGSIVLMLVHERGRLTRLASSLWGACVDTVELVGKLFPILVGASVFSAFIVRAQVPRELAGFAAGLDAPSVVIVIALLLVLVPLGMFLDGASIIIVAAPILVAPVLDLGYSGIWFGILFIKLLEIGLMTPPVGLNAYVLAGTRPDLKVEGIFRAFTPFYVAEVITIVLLLAFPTIVLLLPRGAGLE